MATLSEGVAIATYIGHAHYYQLAVTDRKASPSWLLGLYDVDTLRNAPRLPIMLEMTCLTSAFFQPNFSGMTIDERLLRISHGRCGGGLGTDRPRVGLWPRSAITGLLCRTVCAVKGTPDDGSTDGSRIRRTVHAGTVLPGKFTDVRAHRRRAHGAPRCSLLPHLCSTDTTLAVSRRVVL